MTLKLTMILKLSRSMRMNPTLRVIPMMTLRLRRCGNVPLILCQCHSICAFL